jgi:hypothetical protein
MYYTDYVVLFEDPLTPDAPVQVMIPTPEFMHFALEGGHLPNIDAYIEDREYEEEWTKNNPGKIFSWECEPKHWNAQRIGPLTEEQAIEYLIIKDLPQRVWADTQSNITRFAIVKRAQLPETREWRNAWRLKQ